MSLTVQSETPTFVLLQHRQDFPWRLMYSYKFSPENLFKKQKGFQDFMKIFAEYFMLRKLR